MLKTKEEAQAVIDQNTPQITKLSNEITSKRDAMVMEINKAREDIEARYELDLATKNLRQAELLKGNATAKKFIEGIEENSPAEETETETKTGEKQKETTK